MNSVAPARRARKRGNGEGSIYQRSDGLWVASLMVGRKATGQPDRRFLYAKTRTDCQKKLDALRQRSASGQVADRQVERTTVAGYLARWLEAIQGTVRESTWQRYEVNVRLHINPALGTVRLTALQPDAIGRLYTAKRASGLSPRSVIYIHATLHRALGLATKWGLVPRNAASLVDPPQNVKHELHPPSVADVVRLLDTAAEQGDRLTPLWTVAAYSGCRLGELLGLQWPDVDLSAGTISIHRTLTATHGTVPQFGEPKTKHSRRTLALSPEALDALRAQRRRQAEERLQVGPDYAPYELVFASGIGTPLLPRNVQRDFQLALGRAGLARSVRFHDLRHFAATLMLIAGVKLKVASERLGHSTIAITADLYTHVIRELDEDAADRIAQAFRGGYTEPVAAPVAAVTGPGPAVRSLDAR